MSLTSTDRAAGVRSHLALPLRVDAGRALAAHAQDSDEDLTQSMALLVSTRPGERTTAPGYGTPDPMFTAPDPGAIAAAAREWEERAGPLQVQAAVDGALAAAQLQRTATGGA